MVLKLRVSSALHSKKCSFADGFHIVRQPSIVHGFGNNHVAHVTIVIGVLIGHLNRIVGRDVVVDAVRLKVVGAGLQSGQEHDK